MSKLMQIERALKGINPAGFQRLCDAYLHRRGYDRINPIGLLIAADKVLPGTPDTLLPHENGKYTFAEYTTQQDNVAEKLRGDLSKCFDEQKTGIPVDRVHEIVICYNSQLTPKEEYALTEECRKHGVLFSPFGFGAIAHDLYEKYPGLARDFLGIEVDTGQVISVDEFVAAYNKSAFATPLDTSFRFRDEDIQSVLSGLETNDLVLVSGRAGVGKTRLALECGRKYLDVHPNAKVRCIFNRGADLFQDLRVHFSEPGHYLILVDDSNRISRFDYALQLLHEQNVDRKIKIIATVRDYALDSAEAAARPYSPYLLRELVPLKDDQIKELVREEFGINNPHYLDRIAEIATGNPRLAIMAGRLAATENTLDSIADVTALYDEYFSTIRDDLDDLNNPLLLHVAGIVAFFRVIDRSNVELVSEITAAFDLTSEQLWQMAQRLHELELVDMYENEVVRISDQVLSTYLFYLSIFQKKVLSFSALLRHFFPKLRPRLIDSLNPVLNAFDGREIRDYLRPVIDRAWREFEDAGDEDSLLHLMDVFWWVKQTDSLIHLKTIVDKMKPSPGPTGDLQFEMSNQLPPPASVLSILDNFRNAEPSARRAALTLLCQHVQKRPADLSLVMRILLESYGMTHRSYLTGFDVENDVLDVLWESCEGGQNKFFSKMFLAVAEPLLHTYFHSSESRRSLSITIIKFELPPSSYLAEFRFKTWDRIFSLYQKASIRSAVVGLLEKHVQSRYHLRSSEIVQGDASQVQSFMKRALNPAEYRHCVLVNDYLSMLDGFGIEVDEQARKLFSNETYALSELLLTDRTERREMGWEEYQEVKQQRLAAYTSEYDENDFEAFFERCIDISAREVNDHHRYEIHQAIVDILLKLADRDAALYARVLDRCLHGGNRVGLGPWALVPKLIDACGIDKPYEILSRGEYPSKNAWLFGYFMALPPEMANSNHLTTLYSLYQSTPGAEILRGFDYFLKFEPFDRDFFVNITRILVNRSTAEPEMGHALADLFSRHSKLSGRLKELFSSDPALLQQAYFASCLVDRYPDYDGVGFNALIDLNPAFGAEWCVGCSNTILE